MDSRFCTDIGNQKKGPNRSNSIPQQLVGKIKDSITTKAAFYLSLSLSLSLPGTKSNEAHER